MTNGQLIFNDDRTFRQVMKSPLISVVKMGGRPLRGLKGIAIEILTGVESGTHPVVISADRHAGRAKTPKPIQHGVGRRAVPDDISEEQYSLEFLPPNMTEHGGESLPVGMDIGKDQITHCNSGLMRMISSATSFGVCPLLTWTTASAIR